MTISSGNHGNSQLANFVKQRLPREYPLTADDLRWLDACDKYLTDEASPGLVLQAAKQACKNPDVTQHIDPFELLIDAGLCNPKLELQSDKKWN
jgi:hypothetical protein